MTTEAQSRGAATDIRVAVTQIESVALCYNYNMNEKRQLIIRNSIVVAVIGYLLFLTYGSVISNYRTNQKINNLEEEISLLELEKQYLADLNLYYATDTYKELEARRKLGLKKKGEAVIKIPISEEKLARYQNQLTNQDKFTKKKTVPVTTEESNPRKWIRFIFKA